jgi:hypothetical protein
MIILYLVGISWREVGKPGAREIREISRRLCIILANLNKIKSEQYLRLKEVANLPLVIPNELVSFLNFGILI